MARTDVAPTRRNYLEIQKTLGRVEEGHDLLEQKRQILVTELMARVEAAKRLRAQIDETMAEAYAALAQAAVQSGITGLMRQSAGIEMGHELSIRSQSVMGVPVPEVRFRPARFGVGFSLADGRSHTDLVRRRFLEALELTAELAAVENAVFRLAREVRRTQRRVRALEKIYIPEYKGALARIEDVLAERQREEFIVLRKVKQKRQLAAARRQARDVSPAAGTHG